MKKLYFHIGSGRCGSTLIQSLFNDKMMHQIFAQHARQYDPLIYRDTGVAAYEDTFIEDHWRPIREKYFEPMKESEFDGFIITQENLLGMRPGLDEKNVCDVSCEKISYLSEGYDPHIIIIIRRQDTYIESLYNQCLKRREVRDFRTFVDEFPLDNWHWMENIDVYSQHFGRDKVTVVPFETKVYADSGRTGFIDAVLMAAGITQRLEFRDLPVVNPSIAPRAIEVQRVANQFLEEEESRALANWFEAHVKKKPDDPHTLMSDELRAQIVEHFRESNARLCDEYLTDYPAAKPYYTGEEAA
ncbi:MAG: hypothetical protein ACFE0S_03680 [Rhodospirillales bacterium]